MQYGAIRFNAAQYSSALAGIAACLMLAAPASFAQAPAGQAPASAQLRLQDRAAQALVDRGVAKRYDYALQTMKDLPYDSWREYDPEDTVRFYALRLHEAGMIQSTPQKILTQGTDWRFLHALKKELKG